MIQVDRVIFDAKGFITAVAVIAREAPGVSGGETPAPGEDCSAIEINGGRQLLRVHRLQMYV
jgi:hypothetical protein